MNENAIVMQIKHKQWILNRSTTINLEYHDFWACYS